MNTEAQSPSTQTVLIDLQWLRSFAVGLAGPADADDLVQDSWIAAWRAQPEALEERALRPWLARVMRNRFRNQLARTRSRRGTRAGVRARGPRRRRGRASRRCPSVWRGA